MKKFIKSGQIKKKKKSGTLSRSNYTNFAHVNNVIWKFYEYFV